MTRALLRASGRDRSSQLRVRLPPLARLGVEPLEGAPAGLGHGAVQGGLAQLTQVPGAVDDRGQGSGQLPHVTRIHQDRRGRGEELLEAWNRGGDHGQPAGLGQAHRRRGKLPPASWKHEPIDTHQRAGHVQRAPPAFEFNAQGLGPQGQRGVSEGVRRLEDDTQGGRLSIRRGQQLPQRVQQDIQPLHGVAAAHEQEPRPDHVGPAILRPHGHRLRPREPRRERASDGRRELAGQHARRGEAAVDRGEHGPLVGTIGLDPLPCGADLRLELWPCGEGGLVSLEQQPEQDPLAGVRGHAPPIRDRRAKFPRHVSAGLRLTVPQFKGRQVGQRQAQLIVSGPWVARAEDRGQPALSSLPEERRTEGRDRLEVTDRGMLPVEEVAERRGQLRRRLASVHGDRREGERPLRPLDHPLDRDLPAPLGQPPSGARFDREDLDLEPRPGERRGEAPGVGSEPQRRIGPELTADEGDAHALTIDRTPQPDTAPLPRRDRGLHRDLDALGARRTRSRGPQDMNAPPFMSRVCPVTPCASGEVSQVTSPAISSGRPMRPRGTSFMAKAKASS